MLQSQTDSNRTDGANDGEKTTTPIAVSGVTNPRAMNTIDAEQQAGLTIPPCAVQLVNGIRYINQCPIQPMINIFLIVHGCSSLATGIVLALAFIAAKYIERSSNPSPNARRVVAASSIGQLLLLVFSVAWLIAGQVWVFGAQMNGFQSSNSTLTTTYCHPNVFWTGFIIIMVTYAIWLILIIVFVVRFIIKRHKTKQGLISGK